MSRHGAPLAHDDTAGGPPLVLLHGFPHDRTLWTQQRLGLGGQARVIVPDLRGFGESPLGPAPVSVDDQADAVAALLDALGIDRAVIGGLSMGGYVALALWRRHPARVRALVLCDTRAGADTPDARARRDAQIAQVRAGGLASLVDALLPGMLSATTFADRPDVVATVRGMMSRQSPAAVIAALEALRDRPDAMPTLPTITVPTLVLVGADDVLTPPAEAEAIAAALPEGAGARVERIPGAGHLPCLERPAAVTRCLADFLAMLDATSRPDAPATA